MLTSLVVMLLAAWPSNPSMKVWMPIHDPLSEMLTPIDQPLDKLEDLTAKEMYVHHTHSLGAYRHIH